MPHSFAYAQSDYEVPIGSDAQVLINGIDARSFGAELTAFPDIALPGTRQQTVDLLDRNYAQYARDLYTGFNFDLTFQVVGKTPTDLNQKATDFLSFLSGEKKHRNSFQIEPIIVEFPSLYLVSDDGTVTYSSADITGSGTRFGDYGNPDDLIKFAGDNTKYQIKTITSNTLLTLYTTPSSSGTTKAYNLYRRRYLKARYSGSSSHSSSGIAPFIRDVLSTSRKKVVRDITVSFYTDDSYWFGSDRSQDISISGGNGGTDYNFHLINGVGDAGFHPRITIPTTQTLINPRIYKVRHNFVSNFDGNSNYKDITNENKSVTSATGSINLLETNSQSVTGNDSLYISGGSAKFKSSILVSPSTTRREHATINYRQGHLSTWIKGDFSSSYNQHYIIDFGSGGNNNLYVYYDAYTNEVVAKIGSSYTASASVTLSDNSFYNIQVSWETISDNKLNVYVRKYDSNTIDSGLANITDLASYPDGYVYVGSDSSEEKLLNGFIDEIVIWGKVLTSTERGTLGTGGDPMLISPQFIQAHIGTTGDSYTGINYISCDDNNIHEITSVERHVVNTPDDFSVKIPRISFEDTFEESASRPTVTIYDEFSGERGNFTVSNVAHAGDDTTLTLEPFEDSTNMTHTYTSSPNGNMSSPDEIGVHALCDATQNTTLYAGGNWYSNASVPIVSPSDDRDDIAFSAWIKINESQLNGVPVNTYPDVNKTTNDKAYIFDAFINSLDDGWGIAIDSNGKPIVVTHRLNTESQIFDYSPSSVTVNVGAGSPTEVLSYTNNTTDEWHRIEFAGWGGVDSVATGNLTFNSYYYEDNVLITKTSLQTVQNPKPSSMGSVLFPYTPVLLPGESISIRVNITDSTQNVSSVYIYPTIKYKTVIGVTKYLHEESQQPNIADDEWHHIAVIYEDDTDEEDTYYDGTTNLGGEKLVSGKVHFYIDGVKKGNATNVERLSFGNTRSKYPRIGFSRFNLTTFPGAIRDVRIYSGAGLSDDRDYLFVNRLMCANGNGVEWNQSYKERHWWKFMDRPTVTSIADKGYHAMVTGYPSNLYMRGDNYGSDYSSNGRNQTALLSKSYFCDPTVTKMPSIGAFRIYNETDKYESSDEGTTHTTDWSVISSDSGISPFVGDKMLKLGNKSSSHPLAGLSIFIPKGSNTSGMGLTLSGYFYKTDSQSVEKPIIIVDSIDTSGSGIDFSSVGTEITRYYAEDPEDSWTYFEIPFSESVTTSSINAITFLQPNDTGSYYFCGLDIRRNFATGGGFDAESQVDDHVDKIWSSDTDTSLFYSTVDERTGDSCLHVYANDDAQGMVYRPNTSSVFYDTSNDSDYFLSVYAKKVNSGEGNIIVSSLGLNGAGNDIGSVQYVGEIPVTNTSYSNMTSFLQLPTGASQKKFRLTFKDADSFRVDGITLRSRVNLAYTKVAETATSTPPSYVFSEKDLGVSLTGSKFLYYNDVVGMKSQGSSIIRIKPMTISSSSTGGDNIIANSGGERYGSWNATTGTYSSSTDYSSSGSSSISSDDGVYQNVIGLKLGKSYAIKMDILANSSTTVTFGKHDIDVDSGTSDTESITSNVFTKTISASEDWQSILETVTGTDENYILKIEGDFYLDGVSVDESSGTDFESVLFSWHADDGNGNPDTDDYLRLCYSNSLGFVLQRSNSGSLETLATNNYPYDANMGLEVAFTWDENPYSDPFTGRKYYGTIVINGEKFGVGESSITGTTGTYKHLFVGCQGGYSSEITSTMHVDAVVDGLMISNRVISTEEMIGNYVVNDRFKSDNDLISMPDMGTGTQYFVYQDGHAHSSKNSVTHFRSIEKHETSNVTAKSYGLNDNDKVVLYSKFGETPSSGFDIQLDYEPRYR